MNSKPAETRAELADEITEADIQKLTAEKKEEAATCKVVTENDKRFLVCQWPAL